jgi:hypothetical protein
MRYTFSARFLSTLLCASLFPVSPVFAEQTIRCKSKHYSYQYCRANTDNRVTLERQLSSARCRQGDSWGYDRHGVWVDRGCEASFRVGRGHRDSGSSSAVAAGAAVAGIALIAAIAANKSQSQEDVASWAVGTFRGYDDYERTDVEVTILPGGSVSGYAGNKQFSGSFKGTQLSAGRHRFSVERSGNGFLATDEDNSSHRVMFRRTGSGY